MPTTNFPVSLDDGVSLPNPGSGSFTNNPSHAGQHDIVNDAIKAIEAKTGTGASTPIANRVFRGTGTGTSAWAQVGLTTDVTGTLPVANGGIGQSSLTGLTLPNVTLSNPTTSGGFFGSSPSISSPAIVNFTNMTHDHSTASQGGLLQNLYKFAVYPSANVTITSATQKVAFNTKLFDTNTNFDATTNFRYTVPISGYYQINLQVGIGSAGMGITETAQCALYKNGSVLKYSQQITGSGSVAILPRPSISTCIQLTAGDYLEGFAVLGGIYRDIVGGSSLTFFEGFLFST